MDVIIRVRKAENENYYATLGTIGRVRAWEYNVIGVGRPGGTQSLAIAEGRLTARMLGHNVVRVIPWRSVKGKSEIAKREKDLWIKATMIRDQSGLPSEKFMRVVACEGSVLLVLKKYTSLAKGAKLKRK